MLCSALIPAIQSEAEYIKSQLGKKPTQADRDRVENFSTTSLAILATSPGGVARYLPWFDRNNFTSAFRRRAAWTKAGNRMFCRLAQLVISDIQAYDRPAPPVALEPKEPPRKRRMTPKWRASLEKARQAKWGASLEAAREARNREQGSQQGFLLRDGSKCEKPGKNALPILTNGDFSESDQNRKVGDSVSNGAAKEDAA